MDSTGIFSGRSAWFSSSCPRTHVDSWVNNGGSRFSSAETEGRARGGVDFVFLRDLEDPVYDRLSSSTPILLSSLWVQVSAEKNKRIPLGPFLLDENHSSASLLAKTNPNPSPQPFKTPLRPTQCYPPQPPAVQIPSSVPSAPHSDSAHLKRKLSSSTTSKALEPLRFKKPKVVGVENSNAQQPTSSDPPPYVLPNSNPPTTTPLLLLQHISHLLPPASTIPNRGSYRFGTGGKEEHVGGLGVGVFDVEGGREGGRFEAV